MSKLYCVCLERYNDEGLELLPVLNHQQVVTAVSAFESENQLQAINGVKYDFQGLKGIHIFEIKDVSG